MDIRQKLFQYRSYAPLPFLAVMVYFAKPEASLLPAGFVLLAIGEFFRLWGVSIAGSETRTTGSVGGTFLITTGPFAYVRNPLYLGNMMIYVGVGIMSNALFPWLTIAAFLYFYWQYTLIVSLEEEHLAQKFGDEYRRYTESVPRFLLKLRQYNPGTNQQPVFNWKKGLRSEKSTLIAVTFITIVLLILWKVRA